MAFLCGWVGCNTGYFKLENLYKGSTTAAHEYGHTLGLQHPADLDLRGKGIPGIMYPRGTLVDPQFQYDLQNPRCTRRHNASHVQKGAPGGCSLLKIHRLNFINICSGRRFQQYMAS